MTVKLRMEAARITIKHNPELFFLIKVCFQGRQSLYEHPKSMNKEEIEQSQTEICPLYKSD